MYGCILKGRIHVWTDKKRQTTIGEFYVGTIEFHYGMQMRKNSITY